MIAVLGTAMAVGVALAVWYAIRAFGRALEEAERERMATNERVRQIHASAGNRWYPHKMADDTVRWYPVTHEYAVDL